MSHASATPPPPGAGGARLPGLQTVGAGLSVVVVFIASLSLPLAAAAQLGLSDARTSGWVLALFGVPGALGLALVVRYRQPLLATGNIFVLIFVVSLGDELAWPELVGATMVAGAAVLLLGPLGLTDRLARLLPAPIVYGLLAGAVLPFFVDAFTALGDDPVVVGATLLAYLLGRVVPGGRVPAILPALLAGLVAAAATGAFGPFPTRWSWPEIVPTFPVFTPRALLSVTVVLVVLITLQANVPSVVYLRSQGYDPPERVLTIGSGLSTVLGSVLGPMGASLSLPMTAISAGTDAGPRGLRHWAAGIAAGASLLLALLAGLAVDLAATVPLPFLEMMVGLAVLGVLQRALHEVVAGPLVLGPLFAFGIALSELSLLGLGPFFWALATGLAVSWLFERPQWAGLRGDAPG